MEKPTTLKETYKERKDSFMDDLKTIAVTVGVVGVVGGTAIYFGSKQIKKAKQQSAGKDALSIGKPENTASMLRLAFENDYWPGTDEEALFAALNQMPSQAYYQEVIKAYRKLYESSFWMGLSNDLAQDMKSELSSSDYMKAAQIIASKPLR